MTERGRKWSEYLGISCNESSPFTDAQEKRIREIVKEELPKFEIDSDAGALIVENRLQQLREKANS